MSSEPSSSSNPVTNDDTTMAEPSPSSSQPAIKDTPMAERSESVITDTTMAEPSSSSEPVINDSVMLAGPSSSSEPVIKDSTTMLAGPSSSSEPVIKDSTTMLAGPSSSSDPFITRDSTMLAGPSLSSHPVIIKDSTPVAGPSLSSEPVTKDSTAVAGPSSSSSTGQSRPKKLIVYGPAGPKIVSKAKGKEKLSYDFVFLLKPATRFRHCIGALSNHKFNPSRMGLLEIDDLSLTITVHSVSQSEPGCEEEHVFGFLNLEPDFFNAFKCVNPVNKMINLEIVLVCLSTGYKASALTVYSVHGSNELTFSYELDARGQVPRTPSVVELHDEIPGYKRFPQVLYGFDSSVPSTLLRPLVEQILKQEPSKRADFMTMEMHPAKVKLIVGDYVVDSATESGEVWLNWPFWETLRRATYTSDKCEIYLVTEPPESIMLMFKMSDPDDMICFRKGTFVCDQELSCLVFLRSLT